MEEIKEGDRVRYSDEFLATCDPSTGECLVGMEGIVIAIFGSSAQIDLGSAFRATSTIEIVKLKKVRTDKQLIDSLADALRKRLVYPPPTEWELSLLSEAERAVFTAPD
jgi:hypothetical protein